MKTKKKKNLITVFIDPKKSFGQIFNETNLVWALKTDFAT